MTRFLISHYYLFLAFYFVLLTGLAIATAFGFRRGWFRKTAYQGLLAKLSITFFSTLYLLLLLEGLFAYAFVQSDGFAYTLASKRWFYQYWNPKNSYGYRDQEPHWREKTLFIVGDSFVAGHGIKRIQDRFANVLATHLGDEWTVATLADNGWSPKQYLRALQDHDQQPDLILVSYYLNDIQSAAFANGIEMPSLRIKPSRWISPLLHRSYLANWIYWRIYRGTLGDNTFWDYLESAYGNESVWNDHVAELNALIHHAKQSETPIGFLIWPNLVNVAGSQPIAERVTEHLTNQGVPVLNLATRFENRAPRALIVNPMDAHPSKAVHAEVAELLFQTFAPWNQY